MRPTATLIAGFLFSAAASLSFAADWSKVDEAMGRAGSAQPGDIRKYSFPRTDLTVSVDGVQIKAPLALGSWLAFAPMGNVAMVMGDLVLTETELSAVMKRLLDDGFSITAIHNHLIRTTTPVYYMHVSGHGNPQKLATTLHEALGLSRTPLAPAAAAVASPAIDLDTAALEQTLGTRASASGGVYQFSIPRAETIKEDGMTIPPSMGTAIGINFQPTGGGKAATTGDFVLTGREVNPVLKTLRSHGIEVTALHSHMIDESPHLYFMHFWANADAQQLAKGLRAALDQVNVQRR